MTEGHILPQSFRLRRLKMIAMPFSDSTVFIVDDDQAVRDSVGLLLASYRFLTEGFASASAFLTSYSPDRPGCVIVDLLLPDMDGICLQQTITEKFPNLPAIFVSGHGDIASAVRAMKCGAIDFLEKPFCERILLERVEQALQLDVVRRQQAAWQRDDADRCATLTGRELEVMKLLCGGLTGKQMATTMGISYKTLEKFRARVMLKMKAGSVSELTMMALSLGLVTRERVASAGNSGVSQPG